MAALSPYRPDNGHYRASVKLLNASPFQNQEFSNEFSNQVRKRACQANVSLNYAPPLPSPQICSRALIFRYLGLGQVQLGITMKANEKIGPPLLELQDCFPQQILAPIFRVAYNVYSICASFFKLQLMWAWLR